MLVLRNWLTGKMFQLVNLLIRAAKTRGQTQKPKGKSKDEGARANTGVAKQRQGGNRNTKARGNMQRPRSQGQNQKCWGNTKHMTAKTKVQNQRHRGKNQSFNSSETCKLPHLVINYRFKLFFCFFFFLNLMMLLYFTDPFSALM